jgi:hypothetical protein
VVALASGEVGHGPVDGEVKAALVDGETDDVLDQGTVVEGALECDEAEDDALDGGEVVEAVLLSSDGVNGSSLNNNAMGRAQSMRGGGRHTCRW